MIDWLDFLILWDAEMLQFQRLSLSLITAICAILRLLGTPFRNVPLISTYRDAKDVIT